MTTPSLRIVAGGEPTDEELAALVTVVSVMQTRGTNDVDAPAPSRWRRSARPAHDRRQDGWLGFSRRTSLRPGR